MDEKSLWEEFRIGEELFMDVEGILYASRFSLDRITIHREQVIVALKSMGIEMSEVEEGIGIHGHTDSNIGNVSLLLEELSVLNQATDYKAAGINGVEDLQKRYSLAFLRYSEERRLPEAYDMVTIEIPRLVSGLRAADIHNSVLYPHERKALEDLLTFAKHKDDLMNGHGGYVILGAR